MLRKVILAASLWAAAILAGCGHDAGISASVPGDLDPEPDFVGGGVLAPNGIYAAGDSLWWRFTSLFAPPAYALANADLVGPGVYVTLYVVFEENIVNGVITDAMAAAAPQPTDPTGHFSIPLVDGHTVGECGLFLSVGTGVTLSRAFVYSDDQDVDAVSEAVVRSILNYIKLNPSVRLCDYSASDIEDLTALADFIATDISGNSVEELNAKVYEAVWSNAEMQDLLEEFSF